MLLIDAGPIVALMQKNDGLHARAQATADTILDDLYTTQACLTEALYLLGASGGWRSQRALREMIDIGDLNLLVANPPEVTRAFAYMERFRDIPCDYADATLLVAAEEVGIRQIFTFDKHFYAYRLLNGDHLNIIS